VGEWVGKVSKAKKEKKKKQVQGDEKIMLQIKTEIRADQG
jgi:hypothetical protein